MAKTLMSQPTTLRDLIELIQKRSPARITMLTFAHKLGYKNRETLTRKLKDEDEGLPIPADLIPRLKAKYASVLDVVPVSAKEVAALNYLLEKVTRLESIVAFQHQWILSKMTEEEKTEAPAIIEADEERRLDVLEEKGLS